MKGIPALLLGVTLLSGCAQPAQGAFLKEVPLNNTSQSFVVPENISDSLFKLTAQITPAYFKTSQKANQIFSPLSLWYALGVLREGAAGASLAELNEIMKLPGDFNSAAVIPVMSRGLNFMESSKLTKETVKNGIRLTNGIFFEGKYRKNLKDSFMQRAAEVWGTESAAVDFTNKAATQKIIQDWVSSKTEGFIPNYEAVFPNDGTAILNIYNVLYLQDVWIDSFAELPGEVFHAPGKEVSASFIAHSKVTQDYQETPEYRAAAFPSEKGIRVWFIVPKSGSPLDLLPQLKPILERSAQSDQRSVLLNFKAPFLDVDGENLSLKSVLMDQGYQKIFTQGEFDQMISGIQTNVNEIRQKTRLKMDEKGFKAAAVTEIGMVGTSLPADPPVDFTVDRPYLLFIEYQGLPLFVAQITDPTEK